MADAKRPRTSGKSAQPDGVTSLQGEVSAPPNIPDGTGTQALAIRAPAIDKDNVARFPKRKRMDRTAQERKKRWKERRKADAGTAGTTAPTTSATRTPVPALGTPVPAAGTLPITLAAALAIAGVHGFMAVVGLTVVCAGAFRTVLVLGCALEFAKVSAVAWLGQHHGRSVLRLVVAGLVAILMGLSSIGSYGYLAQAHISHVTAHRATIDQGAANVEARAKVQSAVLADIDRRLHQLDSAVDEATRRGRTVQAMALVDQQRRNRAELVLERDRDAQKLAGIEVEASRIRTERDQLAADDGPIVYIAELLGIGADTTMKWFIAAVSILLDPLACALLLAATRRRVP